MAGTVGRLAFAAVVHLDFDTDLEGLYYSIGNAEWLPNGGRSGSSGDGFLVITGARPNQQSAVVMADFEAGLRVGEFQLEADLRIGGGAIRPAHGFSFSLARTNDPVVTQLTGGSAAVFTEFSGTDDASSLPEEGTRTGVAVSFDAWETGTIDGVQDVAGISVRVDGQLVFQAPVPLARGNIFYPSQPNPGAQNGAYIYDEASFRNLPSGATNYPSSLQTGKRNDDPGFDPTAPQPRSDDPAWGEWLKHLNWERFVVTLREGSRLSIRWKDVELTPTDGIPVSFTPGALRIVIGGRTGSDGWQAQHLDNLKLTTIPAPELYRFEGTPTGFRTSVALSGPAPWETNSIRLTMDGVPVQATYVTLIGGMLTVEHSNPARLLEIGSTHLATLTISDATGRSDRLNGFFIVPEYITLPPEFVLPGIVRPKFTAITRSGGGVKLDWSGPGVLQESIDAESWTNVPGNPGSGVVLSFESSSKFFRLELR